MREFKKRRSPRQDLLRFYISAAALLAVFIITFSAANAAWGMYQKFSAAAQSDEVVTLQLQELQAQEAQVSASVARMQTPRGTEAVVRENYGLGLPGEGEIEIVHNPTSTPAAAPPQPPLWARLWHAVFPW